MSQRRYEFQVIRKEDGEVISNGVATSTRTGIGKEATFTDHELFQEVWTWAVQENPSMAQDRADNYTITVNWL